MRGGGQWIVDNLPWWWALGLAATYFAWDPSARLAPAVALSLCLSVGFWCLLFGGGRWLYRWSRWTLLLTTPLFSSFVLLGCFQQLHHYFFGAFVDDDRFLLIQLNWDTVVAEVLHGLGALPRPVVFGALVGLAVPFALYVVASRRSPFTPLRGAGGARALAGLLWLGWWGTEYQFYELGSTHTPDLAGHVFANEIRESLSRPSATEARAAGADWIVRRAGTASVPKPELSSRRDARAAGPNLVLILLESVRADHLPSYGYHRNTMPYLAELASRPGTFQFAHAYANSSTSYFSMLALLSGLDLSRDYDTFARAPLVWDHLSVRGYQTFVVTQSTGYPRYLLDDYMRTPGLGSYLDVGQSPDARLRMPGLLSFLRGRLVGRFADALRMDRDDARSLDAFEERVRARDRSRPFFGLWELECTHYPYCYPDASRRFEPANAYLHAGEPLGSLKNDYDNALLQADRMIRRSMDFLAAEGLAHDTVVVITSDHGESFLENGVLFHAGPLYVEQTRVPLLLVVPDPVRSMLGKETLGALSANATGLAQSIDLLPTLVDLADLGRASGRLPGDGASLLRPIDADRELRLTNHPPFRSARRRRQDAIVSRRDGYRVVHGDDRSNERYALDGRRVP